MAEYIRMKIHRTVLLNYNCLSAGVRCRRNLPRERKSCLGTSFSVYGKKRLSRPYSPYRTPTRKKLEFTRLSNVHFFSEKVKGTVLRDRFENVDENGQILALIRAATDFLFFRKDLGFLVEIKHLLSGKC
jgi:hypothetical protein